jgi:hypothetical protein
MYAVETFAAVRRFVLVKRQTLRQQYRLPERGAHTALGDVDTVVDLFQNVLRPLAETRSLDGWSDIRAFTEVEWLPKP